jgi:hypothetical protein
MRAPCHENLASANLFCGASQHSLGSAVGSSEGLCHSYEGDHIRFAKNQSMLCIKELFGWDSAFRS